MSFDTTTAIPIKTNKEVNPEVSAGFDMSTARPLMANEIIESPKTVALDELYHSAQDRRKTLDQMVAEGESYDKSVMKYLGEEPPTPISVMHDAMNEFAKLTKGPVTLMKALPPIAEWNFIAGLGRAMTPETITDPKALLIGALKNVGMGDPDIVTPLISSLDIKNPNAAALLSLLPSALQFETLTNGLGGKLLTGAPAEELNPKPLTISEQAREDIVREAQRMRQEGLEGAKAFFKDNPPEKVYNDIKDLFEQGKLQLLDYPDVETASKDLTQRIYSHWQSSLYQARIAGVAPRIRTAAKLLTGKEGFMYIPDTKAIQIAKQIMAGEPAEFPAETLESIMKASGSPITAAVVKIGEKTYTGATHEEALNKAGLTKGEVEETTQDIIDRAQFEKGHYVPTEKEVVGMVFDSFKDIKARKESEFLIGPTAAGKSSIAINLTDEVEIPIIDPDRYKTLYKGYTPEQASLYHEASSVANRVAIKKAIKEGLPFLNVITGRNTDKFKTIVAELKASGRPVKAHYIYVNLDESLRRNELRRTTKKGMVIPDSAVKANHEGGIKTIFEVFVPEADELRIYGNPYTPEKQAHALPIAMFQNGKLVELQNEKDLTSMLREWYTLRGKELSDEQASKIIFALRKNKGNDPQAIRRILDETTPQETPTKVKPTQGAVEGKDYQALFRTAEGKNITRAEAKEKYDIERSTDLHQLAAQYIMDIASKVKQPITHKTFTGIIKSRGGIDFSQDYNVDEMKEFGLKNTPGAPTPDDWAATLMDEGLLQVPENMNPGDYLIELLKTKAGRKIEELFSESYYNRQYKEYLRDVAKDEGLDFNVAKMEKESMAEQERQINALLKAAGKPSVMSKNEVKAIIRQETGQVSAGELVSEESALKGQMKAAQRASKAGYRVGKAEGIAKEKERTAEMELRARARKEAATEIRSLTDDIKGLNTDYLPLEYKEQIDALKDKYDLSKRTQKTLAKREGMKAFVERQRGEGETINIPDEQLELLDKLSLNEMTLDDLRELHGTIMRLYHLGKLKDKLLTAQTSKKFAEVVKAGVDTISKGEGLKKDSTLVKALKDQDKSIAEMNWDKLQYFMKVNLRPEVMFNQMDNWDVKGISSQVCWDTMESADETQCLNRDVTMTMLEDIFKGITPKELHKKYDIGRYKGITKDMMFKIYVHSFNENGLNYLYGSGVSDEDIKAISDFLSDKEKEAITKLFDFMDNYMYPRIAEVYEDLEGARLDKEENYFPIARTEGVQYDKELEKEILQARYARKPGVSKGFTKERTGVEGRGFQEFRFFKDLEAHIDKVEHYIAFARAVRDARKYLYAPEIKEAISQKYGDDYYKMLDKWLKDVAYGKLSRTDEFWSNVLQASRRQFAPAVLSFNLLTTAKQVLGFFPGMEYAGKSATLKFTAKYALNPIKTTRWVKSKSVMMRYRNMRQEREFEELSSRWSTLQNLGKLTGWNRVQAAGLYLTLATDRVISTCVWGGAYEESLSKGMDEEAAIKEANRVTRRTQPMGGLIHLPDLFRGSEAQRQITFLRGHTNKFLNLQYEMVAKKKGGKSSNGKFISQLLWFSLIPAAGFFWIEKKRLPKTMKEWVGAVGRQTTISLWLVENFFQYLESGYFSTDTPVQSYLNDLAKIFIAKKPGKRIEKAVEFLGEVAGAPVVGVRRLIKGQLLGAPEKGSKYKGVQVGGGSSAIDKLFKEQFGQ